MTGASYPSLPLEQFEQIPFIQDVPTDGRVVFLLPYYDHAEGNWYLYLPVGAGELGRIGGGEPVTGAYYSTARVAQSDVAFPLGTLVTQYTSFPGVVGAWQQLTHPLFQLCAALEKFELLQRHKPAAHLSLSHLAAADFEYLLVVIRSVYDLVQKVAKHVSSRVVKVEDFKTRVMKDLPDTFSRMVLRGNRALTSEELQQTRGVPAPIADFYASEIPHFSLIRSLRDAFVHHGEGPSGIFEVEGELGVALNREPWSQLDVWDRNSWVRDKRFGSLRGVFYFLANDALQLTTRYANAFVSCMAVKPAIVPGCGVYLRHPFSERLSNVDSVLAEPWAGKGQ